MFTSYVHFDFMIAFHRDMYQKHHEDWIARGTSKSTIFILYQVYLYFRQMLLLNLLISMTKK